MENKKTDHIGVLLSAAGAIGLVLVRVNLEREQRFRGARVSGGDLCAAEAPTEPIGETRGDFSAKVPLTKTGCTNKVQPVSRRNYERCGVIYIKMRMLSANLQRSGLSPARRKASLSIRFREELPQTDDPPGCFNLY